MTQQLSNQQYQIDQTIRSYINDIRKKYNHQESLSAEDEQIIKKLLLYDYDRAKVNDVERIYIKDERKEHNKLKKIFWLKYQSGKHFRARIDTCIKKAVDYKTTNDRSIQKWKINIRRAFRCTIKDQIKEFRSKHNLNQDEEVDHQYPFVNILHDFMNQLKLTYDDLSTKIRFDERLSNYVLNDDELVQKFQDFHKKVAELQPLSTEENRAKIQSDFAV